MNFISGADPWKERRFIALLFLALLDVLSPMGQHLNIQRTNPKNAKVGFFLTVFPSPLPHDGKPAAKWSYHNKRQEDMICLRSSEVERVNVKPSVEHPVPLTHHWFLTSLLLSNDFL